MAADVKYLDGNLRKTIGCLIAVDTDMERRSIMLNKFEGCGHNITIRFTFHSRSPKREKNANVFSQSSFPVSPINQIIIWLSYYS